MRRAIAPAHSAMPPFTFFMGGFEFSVEVACKMAVCIDVTGKRQVTIKSIASAKGRPSPLQGGMHASHVALCGPGPHAFFFVETCFCTVYKFNICYFFTVEHPSESPIV